MDHLQQENFYVVERGFGDQEQSPGKAENRVADHSGWKGRKLQMKQTCINSEDRNGDQREGEGGGGV